MRCTGGLEHLAVRCNHVNYVNNEVTPDKQAIKELREYKLLPTYLCLDRKITSVFHSSYVYEVKCCAGVSVL